MEKLIAEINSVILKLIPETKSPDDSESKASQ